MNVWEQLEEHIQDNLGYYGLKFQDRFLELKEHAEDLGLCLSGHSGETGQICRTKRIIIK
ncbi:hypothetical protein CL634_10645 [bacterium]|nr:hypothetical protein [bacterium]